MWHEARKQERKIRGIMVDYKRRAERRKDFYEKIKADPTQFLQIHGRSLKVHLDPSVAAAGDSPANMMPWQGHADILIDRFDVRAHLDYIPENNHSQDRCGNKEITREERLANYERYRIIVQNDFLGVGEEKFLHQLYVDEQYGPVNRVAEVEKKKKGEKAAIPYTYEESSIPQEDEDEDIVETEEENGEADEEEEDDRDSKLDEEEDDSDIDFDLCVDVSKVDPQQAHEMNLCGAVYGMVGNDFFSFLSSDIQEKESQRQAREQEEEKAMFSGRKSRRERRAFREKRLQGRKISPPSYAARSSPTYYPYRKSTSKSRSRSHSPIACGRITYITSFGGEEEEDPNKDRRIKQSTSTASKLGKDVRGKASRFEGVFRSGGPTSTSHYSRHKSSSYRSPSPIVTHQSSEEQRRKRMAPHSPKDGATSVSRSRSRRYVSPDYKLVSRRDSRSSDNSSTSPHSNSSHRSRCKEKKPNKNTSVSRSPYRNISYSSKCWNRRRSSSSSASVKMETSSAKAKDGDKNESPNIQQHQPPIKKYYSKIRRSSSPSMEENSDSNCSMVSSTMNDTSMVSSTSTHKITKTIGNSGAEIKLQLTTPQEKLKKKMQALLNRQYKADKKAERMRSVKLEQERQDREDELREMAIKLRRRERERRHRMQDDNEDGDDDGNESEDKSATSVSNTSSQSPNKSQQERNTPEQQNVEPMEDIEDKEDATVDSGE